jgi:hypothetical protein
MRRVVVALFVCLVAGTVATAIAGGNSAGTHAHPARAARAELAPPSPPPIASAPSPWSTPKRVKRRHRAGPLVLAGCPPPPRPPGPPGPGPWHPAHKVPDSKLPRVKPPRPWHANLGPVNGKGMWMWQYDETEGGNAGAIVRKAARAGLRQLWVRVGSSKDRFYGDYELAALVDRAHRAGLSVIGWGFPYLYDPVGDARWTAQALAWRSPSGGRIDAFSADLEKSTEGVAMTKRRVAVYLQAVRRAAGNTPIVATVYRPTDLNWYGPYPYRTMARYVDAFAPMVYWGCTDPREAATESLERLSKLRPVHLIGQAYNMAPEGGRTKAPSAREINAFLSLGHRDGALGASFWDWQEINGGEWKALSRFDWSVPPPTPPPTRAV